MYVCVYNYNCACFLLAPPYIGLFMFNATEVDINIYSPNGTVVFETLFIINPNVTVEHLSFDITTMMVGESNFAGDFLINGTTPPLVVQAPFQSLYMLTVLTGGVLNTSSTMDIIFSLIALVNTSSSITETMISNVTVHQIGEH